MCRQCTAPQTCVRGENVRTIKALNHAPVHVSLNILRVSIIVVLNFYFSNLFKSEKRVSELLSADSLPKGSQGGWVWGWVEAEAGTWELSRGLSWVAGT